MVYTSLAYVYDRLMEDAPYDQWIDFTKSIFSQSTHPINTIADLGCGTGEITMRLANLGYIMHGIDASLDMLTCAEQKAREQQLKINWLNQDLRQLEGLACIDAVISYCDVINYIISKSNIETVFKKVYECLHPEGIFIFDVHAMAYVKNYLSNQTYAYVADDISYIWFAHEGQSEGEVHHDLTFFTYFKRGTYERFDEYHQQKTYPPSIYEQLLKNAGFQSIHLYFDFSLDNNVSYHEASRVFFVARK